jgi:CRISPR system Cascade subunit CasA
LDEPWVPVVVGGARREVSLRQALVEAHTIDGLALDEPLQAVAVLRQVLLPVVLAALGVPAGRAEWGERWDARRFDGAAIEAYLRRWADSFELFDGERPFGQVAGLRTERGETKPVSLLLAATATGNNVPVFTARTEADPPALSPAQAVRALLAAQCWDTAAIKSGAVGDSQMRAGKTTGNPTGPLGQLGVIVPCGRSLFATLMLNTPILEAAGSDDCPQWTHGQARTAEWESRPASGLLDLLTWQSRRIRLVPELEGDRVVVRRVVVAAGDRLQAPPQVEPHTMWRQNPDPRAGQGAVRPMRHQPGRAAWQGLSSMLALPELAEDKPKASTSLLLAQISGLRTSGHLPENLPLQVFTVGVVYGNQSAVVEDVMVDLIPLPVLALDPVGDVRGLLLDVVGHAEQLREAANRLGDDLRRAAGGDRLPRDRGQRLGEVLVFELTPVVRRLLYGLQREPEKVHEANQAWRSTAQRLALEVAQPVLNAAPPEAFLGRKESEKVTFRVSLAEVFYRAKVKQILGLQMQSTMMGERL